MTVLLSIPRKAESGGRLGRPPMKLLALLFLGMNPDTVVGQLRVSLFISPNLSPLWPSPAKN